MYIRASVRPCVRPCVRPYVCPSSIRPYSSTKHLNWWQTLVNHSPEGRIIVVWNASSRPISSLSENTTYVSSTKANQTKTEVKSQVNQTKVEVKPSLLVVLLTPASPPLILHQASAVVRCIYHVYVAVFHTTRPLWARTSNSTVQAGILMIISNVYSWSSVWYKTEIVTVRSGRRTTVYITWQ